MPCFICKEKSHYYQRLNSSRIRFIRKVFKDFADDSYLCLKCFEKFEKIFKTKKKTKNASLPSVGSNVTVRTDISSTSPSIFSEISVRERPSAAKENTIPNSDGPDLDFGTHDESNDSTDRLVQSNRSIAALRHSTRVDADVLVARQAANPAVNSALRRKRTRGSVSPPPIPARRRYECLSSVGEDNDDESLTSPISDSDSSQFAGPIVKKRKEPVVHLNKDVMDIYLANTSGG